MSDNNEITLEDTGQLSGSAPVNENAVIEPSWRDSLSEDLKGDSSIQDIKDLDGLVKSYKSAQTMLGSSVRIPSDDASPEAKAEFYSKLADIPGITKLPDSNDPESVNQFYNQLGRPENADGYKLNFEEGVEIDETSLNGFKELAHSIGLTNEQANKLAEFEATRYKDYNENLAEARQSAESVLKDQWGNDYDNRLSGAKEVMKMYGEKYPDAVQDLVNGPAGNNPAFLSMLSELYGSLKESGTISPSSSNLNYGMSSEDAKMQIQDIMENSSHAYFNDSDPNHKEAVSKMSKLFNAAYPDA